MSTDSRIGGTDLGGFKRLVSKTPPSAVCFIIKNQWAHSPLLAHVQPKNKSHCIVGA